MMLGMMNCGASSFSASAGAMSSSSPSDKIAWLLLSSSSSSSEGRRDLEDIDLGLLGSDISMLGEAKESGVSGCEAESMLFILSRCLCSLDGDEDSLLLGMDPSPRLSIDWSLETGFLGFNVDRLLPLLLLSSSSLSSSAGGCGTGSSPRLRTPKLLSLMEAVGVCPESSWRSEAMKKVVGVLLVGAGLLFGSGSAILRFRGGALEALLPTAGLIMAGECC